MSLAKVTRNKVPEKSVKKKLLFRIEKKYKFNEIKVYN